MSRDARQVRRDREHQLALVEERPDPSKVDEVKVLDVGFLRFCIRHDLQRILPNADINVIELITEFARPDFPRLAVFGSLGLQAGGSTLQNYGVESIAVNRKAIASDGKLLVGVFNNPLQVVAWNLSSQGRPCDDKVYSGAEAPITSVSVSADANFIVGGCEDGTIHVWNISDGDCIAKCEYYEWSEFCGCTGVGHYSSVTTASCGSVYGFAGTDIVSGDENGTLCAWQLGPSSGTAKLCVDVRHQVNCPKCSIDCTACQLGLVLCGLREGFVVGYLTDSNQCAFMLAPYAPSPVLAIGLMQKKWNDEPSEAESVSGCFADGSVLRWNLSGRGKDLRIPVLGHCVARSNAANRETEVSGAVASLVSQQGDSTILWAARHHKSDSLMLRWSEVDAMGQLRVLSGYRRWPASLGDLRGLAQL